MIDDHESTSAPAAPARGQRRPGSRVEGAGRTDARDLPRGADASGLPARDARVRFPMSAPEEVFANDRTDEPATMHFELRVSGSFDEGKLRGAIAAAIATHPMSQVRLIARRFALRAPLWELSDPCIADTLVTIDCPDDRAMTAIRDDFYSLPVDLQAAPALVVLLVRRPAGDSLLFKIHHSIMDGIGALRWINSVARAYTGKPDPVPAVDPIAVRDLRAHFGSDAATAPVAPPEKEPIMAVAQVAGPREAGAPGYGIRLASLSPDQCARLDPCRFGADATLNDLLLAALHLTIASWNAGRDEPCERISILVPANLRPLAWNHEVVANLAIVDRNRTSAEDRSTPERLMAAVTGQMRRMRAGNEFARFLGRPRWQCWAIANIVLPLILYKPWAVPGLIKGAVDTILFANLGRIERRVSGFGEAGELTEFWVSPPVSMPMGIGLDAAILRGRLHLTLRHRLAMFGSQDAENFLESFVTTLCELGRGVPSTAG